MDLDAAILKQQAFSTTPYINDYNIKGRHPNVFTLHDIPVVFQHKTFSFPNTRDTDFSQHAENSNIADTRLAKFPVISSTASSIQQQTVQLLLNTGPDLSTSVVWPVKLSGNADTLGICSGVGGGGGYFHLSLLYFLRERGSACK